MCVEYFSIISLRVSLGLASFAPSSCDMLFSLASAKNLKWHMGEAGCVWRTSNGSSESHAHDGGQGRGGSQHAHAHCGRLVVQEVAHGTNVAQHHAGVEDVSARQKQRIWLQQSWNNQRKRKALTVFPFFFCFCFNVAKHINVKRLFRNSHPSLQYTSHSLIHMSL